MALCGSYQCQCGVSNADGNLSISGSGEGGDPFVIEVATDPPNLAKGTVDFISITSDPPGGIGSTPSDITGLSVAITPVIGRRYHVTGVLRIAQVTTGGLQELMIRDGSGTTLNKTTISVDAAEVGYHVVHYVFHAASSALLILKLSVAATLGTADPFCSTVQPGFLLVEDIGT